MELSQEQGKSQATWPLRLYANGRCGSPRWNDGLEHSLRGVKPGGMPGRISGASSAR